MFTCLFDSTFIPWALLCPICGRVGVIWLTQEEGVCPSCQDPSQTCLWFYKSVPSCLIFSGPASDGAFYRLKGRVLSCNLGLFNFRTRHIISNKLFPIYVSIKCFLKHSRPLWFIPNQCLCLNLSLPACSIGDIQITVLRDSVYPSRCLESCHPVVCGWKLSLGIASGQVYPMKT